MIKKRTQVTQSSCLDCDARKFAWFESGTDAQLQERQKLRTGQYTLPANELLFMEGENHPTCYTLKEGWAICYKQLKSGQRQIVHIALPGDFLGYTTSPETPIDYTVMAITDCVLCSFSEANISLLLQKDTDLIHRLIAIQAKQSKVCRQTLSYVGQSPAKNKLAFFLIEIVERLKRRGINTEEMMSFPISRIDIADAIGITPVHLGRVSMELSQAHIVECRHHTLKIQDYEKLKSMAELT